MCPIVGSGVGDGMAVAGCWSTKVEVGVDGNVDVVSPEQAASAANATRAIGRTECLSRFNNDILGSGILVCNLFSRCISSSFTRPLARGALWPHV